METAEDIASTAIRLAQAGGMPLVYVLALLVAAAVALVLAKKVGSWRPTITPSEPPLKPGPQVGTGEGGGLTDGNGNPVTTDPENPGGGATGGMG